VAHAQGAQAALQGEQTHQKQQTGQHASHGILNGNRDDGAQGQHHRELQVADSAAQTLAEQPDDQRQYEIDDQQAEQHLEQKAPRRHAQQNSMPIEACHVRVAAFDVRGRTYRSAEGGTFSLLGASGAP
jgi:hypothetical protein